MFPSWPALNVLTLFSATKFPSFCQQPHSQVGSSGGHQARSWHPTSFKATVHSTQCQRAGKKGLRLSWYHDYHRVGLPLLALHVKSVCSESPWIKKCGQRTCESCPALKLFLRPGQNLLANLACRELPGTGTLWRDPGELSTSSNGSELREHFMIQNLLRRQKKISVFHE